MPREHDYSVYLLANFARTVLYIGVTNDLEGRLWEHRTGAKERSFTARYRVNRLVYHEEFGDVLAAITREKQLKSWTRAKKEALIARGGNPGWEDLSAGWEKLRGTPYPYGGTKNEGASVPG